LIDAVQGHTPALRYVRKEQDKVLKTEKRISWTLLDPHFEGTSWNPFVGCSKITTGCKNCYAINDAYRFGDKRPFYKGITKEVNGKVNFTGIINRQDSQFYKPRNEKKPHIYFLNSMSDFFHPNADDEWRLEVLEIMKECDRHLFQLLTKRTDEMVAFFKRHPSETLSDNVWLGATVENAKCTRRIKELVSIPASVHFLSLEPLLSPIPALPLNDIEWVVVGGESGLGHRPMKYDWVIDVQQQCDKANTPFFFKQWGHWKNNPLSSGGKDAVEKADTLVKGGELLNGQRFHDHPSLDDVKKCSLEYKLSHHPLLIWD